MRLLFNCKSIALSIFLCMQSVSAQPIADSIRLQDVVSLQADASATVVADTGVIHLAVEKAGAEASGLTNEVNQIMGQALAQAKANSGVEASTGSYTTYPRYDNKGQRNGWIVRAELVLKGKDFGVLGNLAGKLATQMQITSNSFEISRALRLHEEARLQEQALQAFQNKATQAAKSLGYTSWRLRELNIGSTTGEAYRPQAGVAMMKSTMAEPAPLSMEAGNSNLLLTVRGSVVLQK